VVRGGAVLLTAPEPGAFLGIGAGVSGPATVTVKVRHRKGGEGKIGWLKIGEPMESTPFTLTASADWQTYSVEIPAEKPLGVFRVYLPTPIEVDAIELKPKAGEARRWDF
jgi:hypothetical protein